MKAAVFQKAGEKLAILDLPDPVPGEGEVIVRVARCGVCGTDLHTTSGHGFTLPGGSQLGHEYAGEVVGLGADAGPLKLGDHVAAMPVVGCGHCEYCRTGIDLLCQTYRSYGEGLAQYARVNARGATILPKTVGLKSGALVEPLAVGRRAVRLANPDPDMRTLVIGPGPIGLATAFWLRRAGVRRIAMLASSSRREALAEAMGATAYILEGDDAATRVHEALGGMPDLVIESAGVPGVIARAIDLVRPQGQIIALGFCSVPDSIVPAAALMKDVNIRFSTTYTRDDFADSAEALATDGAHADAMITDTVSLADFPDAFEAYRGGKGIGKLAVELW